VPHRLEFLRRRAADLLRRGVGSDELRELLLQHHEFAVEPVILGVADFRRVQRVVEVVVAVDLPPQLLRPPFGLREIHDALL